VRKLKPSEVALLVAGLTIGSGNVEADEQQQVMATITVTATRVNINVGTAFIFSPGYVGYSAIPSSPAGVVVDAATQAQHRQAIECAVSYGKTRGAVPKAGFVTYFANNYGWLETGTRVHSSDSNTPPAAGYEALFGVTTQMHPAYPYIQGQSKIFLKGHASKGDLINTIAHEWAHQWQAYGAGNEAAAEQVGDNVEAAWRADGGQQCGGL
jgi:hypothetical protein